MTSFPEKVLAIHHALDAAGFEHAVGGALALAFHVRQPRATADVDLNVSVPVERAADVLAALPPGVTWAESDVARVQREGQVRLWWERTPVDLFFPQHALHAVAAGRAETHLFGTTPLPFLSATDLTVFKALFDRPKDWVDIEEMLRFGSVDLAEVRRWLVEVVGAGDDRLARLAGVVAASRVPAPTGIVWPAAEAGD